MITVTMSFEAYVAHAAIPFLIGVALQGEETSLATTKW